MKAILELIERRRSSYEQHPFIRFLRDDTVAPARRLSYAPFASFFVLSFADFNRRYLRAEASPVGYQAMVDRHADEDSTHFSWFLHDLRILGYDVECRVSDVLRFLWSDLGRHTRDLSYYAISVTRGASAELRLAIIEAVESMGNVWLTATLEAARAHPDGDRLVYFGPHHLERETGHAIGSAIEEIREISLSPEDRARAEEIVHGFFDRMEAFNAELLERVDAASNVEFTELLR
ncbi:MAG: hypothetical protein KDK70_01955 [Myxococcales bacterium]|nr:hypothetical protein [Myxococcales bacterium]